MDIETKPEISDWTSSGGPRGFAMPAVMGALVIIGVLATAGFYMAQQELRIGVATNHTNLAVNIAQAGANEVMANWNGYQLGNILPWQDTTITGTAPGGAWSVNIANGNNYSYLITSTGTVTRGGALWSGASRTVGIAAKILFADISPPAALMTRGPVTVSGSAEVDGTNNTPPTWGPYCTDVATNDTTGIMVNDTSVVNEGKGTTGNPAVDEDSTIVDSTFTDFGNLTWDELVDIAQIEGKDITAAATPTINGILADPEASSGVCNVANLRNWGDTVPTNVCGSYFPLIYHGGPELNLQANSYGQGILLVDGDMTLAGGFRFYGIIIVQGTFTTGAGTNVVYGSVMASNAADVQQTMTGTGEIHYSRCAVTRAVLNNAALSRARPLAQRSWVDLSAVLN